MIAIYFVINSNKAIPTKTPQNDNEAKKVIIVNLKFEDAECERSRLVFCATLNYPLNHKNISKANVPICNNIPK